MTAPAGVFGAQQQDLADLVALSQTFIDECTASADPVTANHIAVVADERWSVPLPAAIVCTSPDTKLDDWGFAKGSNIVIFERAVEASLASDETTHNSREAEVLFRNWLGDVVSEMLLQSRNGGGHLLNLQADLVGHPQRSSFDERDGDDAAVDYIHQRVKFTWGVK
jgi:hypothetical protein